MARFVCSCCGNCCRWEGVVKLKEEEILTIAQYLGLTPEEFTEQYTLLSDERDCLVLKQNNGCCFLDEMNHCRIQAVKPQQCASFPYAWQATPEQQKLCQGHWEEE